MYPEHTVKLLFISSAILAAAAASYSMPSAAACVERCRCGTHEHFNRTFEEHVRALRDRADAVFEGTVVGIDSAGPVRRPPITSADSFPPIHVRLAVTAQWRGPRADTVTLTLRTGFGCNMPFVAGTQYIVFARTTERGDLSADRCSGTTRSAEGDSTRAVLGAGRVSKAAP